jgi:flagellar motility protein MotE (MotC chaperone)
MKQGIICELIVSCLIFFVLQEKYEQLKHGLSVPVASQADNDLFYQASGGYNDKGRVYGLGSEGPSMFERPARARGGSSGASSAYTSPMVTQLQDQLQSTQSELQSTQSELQNTKARLCATEDELRATKDELDTTRRQLRADLLELHARFDSFSSLMGHPTTRGGNSLDSE